ncbi:hypothetical protein N0V82_000851 [Gnomoniopsis sp. IMI 355080]|nr:hypothetical protein N0V82_000851 [Gnomoniopsis sp. IMI 355080]
MPKLEDIEYSHEGTIDAVRGYYKFLTAMYIHSSEVLLAPPDGWPGINATNPGIQAMSKTDTVIRLLRHLPYIRNDHYRHETQAAPWGYFADWQSQLRDLDEEDASSLRLLSEGADITSNVPAQVIGLTLGGNNNPIFLLDTQLGIVHWVDCPGEVKYDPPIEPVLDDPYDWAPEEEAEWRADSPAWAVGDFFEVLKHQFRMLRFVPLSERVVMDVYTKYGSRDEGMIEMVQGIYREHGWPDDLEAYRKDQCLHAVKSALRKRFPGQIADD